MALQLIQEEARLQVQLVAHPPGLVLKVALLLALQEATLLVLRLILLLALKLVLQSVLRLAFTSQK